MSLYIKGIRYNDLQSVVQLTQKWSAVNGKSKYIENAQLHEASCLSIKLVFLKKVLTDVFTSKSKKAKNSVPFFFQCYYASLQEKSPLFICGPDERYVLPCLDSELALS